MSFVHLHVHSEYSMSDAVPDIKGLITRTKELGMDAIALTDHGNLFGAVDFFLEAKKQGIKAIIGCEVYVAPRLLTDKDGKRDAGGRHLVLLAKNEIGYKNLTKIVSRSHLEGFYYKPRTDLEELKKYHEGLIALSGSLSGEIPRKILEGNLEEAEMAIKRYQEIFGSDFYLEIQNHGPGHERQMRIREAYKTLSPKLNVPLVATNEVHYLIEKDAPAQDAMMCVHMGEIIENINRPKFESNQMYLKSPDEMKELFQEFPEAISNTLKIAEACQFQFKLGEYHLPHFDVPEGKTAFSYMSELTWEGLKERYPEITSEIKTRTEFELSVIEKMGYAAYFLIVADFINWAKRNKIEVGPGRGSAAGSIVAYSLGITNIDPLKYALLFERFLNPERISMPDIDVDFCIRRREEVIDYVTKKYGADRVAQIVTFGTMAARGVIRDVGRVQNVPLQIVDRVAKMVPAEIGITLSKALEQNPDLKKAYDSDVVIRNLFSMAQQLEGKVRHASTHAAGVVISKNPLTELVPLAKNEEQVVTQYSMLDLEKLGLLKMDFLGLRNLTMLADARALIKLTHNVEIDLDHLPLDDAKTYETLCSGDTWGIFQLESSGMRGLIKRLKPSTFEDIVALLALYRPGPLGSGMVDDFINNKHGKTEIKYELSELESILKPTYGLILYQEQVMQIASSLAGFSMGQADTMRRAMGKKDAEQMMKLREQFIAGAVAKKVNQDKAAKIFDLCAKFAEYGFNKSHSAAYAVISYQTAYLKTNYPVEFMAAILSSVASSIDKVAEYIDACKTMQIEVMPPDINHSRQSFTVVHGAIRFGFKAIKNLGDGAIESIIKNRDEKGPYISLSDFLSRVDLRLVNKRALEALIKCGAMDEFGKRSGLLKVMETSLESANRRQKTKATGQVSLFGAAMDSGESLQDALPDEPEFPRLDLLKMEKELIGIYVTDHPLNLVAGGRFETKVKNFSRELLELPENSVVKVGGIITSLRKIVTKTNRQMLAGTIEDTKGKFNFVLFPQQYEQWSDYFTEDGIILIEGKVTVNRDEPQVVVEKVEKIEAGSHKQLFHVEIKGIDDAVLLNQLKTLLSSSPGATPVVLHTLDAKVLTDEASWVNVTPALITGISELVGKGRYWVE